MTDLNTSGEVILGGSTAPAAPTGHTVVMTTEQRLEQVRLRIQDLLSGTVQKFVGGGSSYGVTIEHMTLHELTNEELRLERKLAREQLGTRTITFPRMGRP